jgi:hypothetical protein
VNGERMIFEGGAIFTKKEIDELAKFINYMKISKLPYDKRL